MSGCAPYGGEREQSTGRCMQCGQELAQNDIGAFRKFVNRGARGPYLCRRCLANRLDIPLAQLEEKIAYFKDQGCTLFV